MPEAKVQDVNNVPNAKLTSFQRKTVLISLLGLVYLLVNGCTSYVRHNTIGNNATEVKARGIEKAAEITPVVVDRDSNSTMAEKWLGTASEPDQILWDVDEIDLSLDDDQEPYLNRWQRRFASSEARNKKGGYLFFRHIRKAGGTSLRVYFRNVLLYHNISKEITDWQALKHKDPDGYFINYIEHEFQTIDWQCPNIDPRWRESLRVIVLRHPIERHLSEFFFSGAGKRFSPIDKEQLYVNETYTNELKEFMSKQIPKWMKHIGIFHQKEGIEGKFNLIFGRQYTDNFQLRSLAGCSSGDCLKEKNVTDDQMDQINQLHPSSYSYSTPVARCTGYFRNKKNPSAMFDQCSKPGRKKDECQNGCDGPCFFPSVAWGEVGRNDLRRAIKVLKQFDAVLLTERMSDSDQANFLADIMGVPRDADFSLAKKDYTSNLGVEKSNEREKLFFYRDLLQNLGLRHVSTMLRRENKWEIRFFEYAEQLNKMMIDKWKEETGED